MDSLYRRARDELGQQALETDDFDQRTCNASEAVAETLNNEYCKVLELLPNEDAVFLATGFLAGRR